MSEALQVQADLVLAASVEREFDERGARAEALAHHIVGDGGSPGSPAAIRRRPAA